MTVTAASRLFEPITVGAIPLKHRVVLAPLTRLRANKETGVPSDLAIEYYRQRASDGGLLISEGTMIAQEAGGMPGAPGVHSKEQISKWKEITDAVHSKGGKIVCQLWALGRVADPSLVSTVWGASTLPFVQDGQSPSEAPKVTQLTPKDIERFTGHYVQAAKNAIEAGFDGVEVHGANGYLLDQFLQSKSNNRTDEYGGSLENRFRFPLAVINAVSKAIGVERVGLRMSPLGTFQGMREDDPIGVFLPWAQTVLAAQPKIAYIHAVGPRPEGLKDADEYDTLMLVSGNLDVIRDAVVKAGSRFLIAGGFTTKSAKAHTEQTDDLIVFGRPFIANPDLPERIKNDWPLTPYDRSTFYTPDAHGYTDYPTYKEEGSQDALAPKAVL
ncbi:hypothetical protein BCR39DRAFT_540246 [Naematelia encephala]|uniref:NADH:flavin oxidoreductase/NADH oxidase N-terminal domain-containing protein n=1 Tax=Naematelia encephala TaxID=71784 RepID=A0A1Y2AW28_9TREE|nr:hypothetical protein BCR39DRAFT_540246 [Naematelia encephala]